VRFLTFSDILILDIMSIINITGQVFSVEIAVDLKALETLVVHRQEIRNLLEKAIAVWHATSRRPTVNVKRDFYDGVQPPYPAPISELQGLSKCWYRVTYCCGDGDMVVMDSIDHYAKVLEMMNISVKNLQSFYFEQRQHDDNSHGLRFEKMQKMLEEKTLNILGSIQSSTAAVIPSNSTISNPISSSSSESVNNGVFNSSEEKEDIVIENNESSVRKAPAEAFKDVVINIGSTITDVTKSGAIIMGDVTKQGVEGLALEGLKTAKFATKGALV